MPGPGYVWMHTDIPPKCKLSKWEKQALLAQADQFVTDYYKPAIQPPPPPARYQGNYIVAYSTKWHSSYLQFIARYACPGPNALAPSFEIAFARLGFFSRDNWNIWTCRHTDQWLVLGS